MKSNYDAEFLGIKFSAPSPLGTNIMTAVLVILFIISTVLQIWLTPSGNDPQQQMQRKVMIVVLPVMFGFMFASLPAGLTLYFLVNNIIGIAQQKSYNRGGAKKAINVTLVVSVLTMIVGFVLTKI